MSMMSFKGLNVRYEYVPCSRQPAGNLVLLHSLGLSMEEYDHFIPHFRSAYNVLCFDMLGHGQSESPSEPITVDMLADQLDYITRQFFNGSYYMVAGPGMGYAASRLCRVYNPDISGMVMISPQPIFLSLEEKQQLGRQVEIAWSKGFHAYKQFLISHFTVHREPSLVCRLEELLDQTSEDVHHGLIQALLSYDFRNDFLEINIPTLVLSGMHDTLFPSSTYSLTANYMKAEFRLIPAAAHLAIMDNPAASADAVLNFIAAIESGKSAANGFAVSKEEMAKALFRGFRQVEEETKKTTMCISLLDTFCVQIGDVELTKGWNLRKVKSLFLYLLFHGTVTRDELIEVFWPDLPLDNARNQLRMNLHFLKSLLNQGSFEFLHTDREHIFLRRDIQCDALDYIHSLKKAYTRMLDGDLDIKTARSMLEVLPKKLVSHVYDEWYLQFRDEIEEQYTSLCRWTAERLGDSHESEKYEQMIGKLQN